MFFGALLIASGSGFPNTIVVALVALVLFQIVTRVQRRMWLRQYYSPDRVRGLAGEQHIEITADCLRETAPNRDVTWQWEEYSSIYETPTHVFIRPTPINSVIVPKTAFSSDSQRSELVALVKSCIEKKRT
jgi:hypothetical protein